MHNLIPAPVQPLRGELVKGLGLAIVRTIVRGNCEINRGEAARVEGTWERLHNNNNNNNDNDNSDNDNNIYNKNNSNNNNSWVSFLPGTRLQSPIKPYQGQVKRLHVFLLKCSFLAKPSSSQHEEMFFQNKRSNFSSLLLAAVCQMFFQPFNKPSLKCHLSGNLSQLFIYRKFVSIVIYPKFPKAIFGTSWSASIILVALIRFIFSPS